MRLFFFGHGVVFGVSALVATADEVPNLNDPRETHFGPTVQLTHGGENAKA